MASGNRELPGAFSFCVNRDDIMNEHDKTIIREVAKRVAEIAALPVQARRREEWKRHNSLKSRKPMLLVFPEGSWEELLPDSGLKCEDEEARRIERDLRVRIYYHEHFADDTVCEGEWVVERALERTGWGLDIKRSAKSEERGSFAFEPCLRSASDLKRLRYPEVVEDEKESARRRGARGGVVRRHTEGAAKGVAVRRVSLHAALHGLAGACRGDDGHGGRPGVCA